MKTMICNTKERNLNITNNSSNKTEDGKTKINKGVTKFFLILCRVGLDSSTSPAQSSMKFE